MADEVGRRMGWAPRRWAVAVASLVVLAGCADSRRGERGEWGGDAVAERGAGGAAPTGYRASVAQALEGGDLHGAIEVARQAHVAHPQSAAAAEVAAEVLGRGWRRTPITCRR